MHLYRFIEGWEFDVMSGELRREGTTVRLEPQPAAVLALLAGRAGDVVTHDQIRRAVWGDDRHVNFQESVHYCVRRVRAALGDQPHRSRFIETIPRRGYRLRADALLHPDTVEAPPLSSAANPPEASPLAVTGRFTTRRRRLALGCLVAALAAATAFVERRPNNHHAIAVAVLKTVHDLVY